MDAEPGDIVIVLRPLPSAAPLGVRLRGVLKYALRAGDLKCVSAREVLAHEVAVAGVDGKAAGQEGERRG